MEAMKAHTLKLYAASNALLVQLDEAGKLQDLDAAHFHDGLGNCY